MAREATLYRMVTEDHVCPFGIKARHLLRRKGYSVDDRHLKSRPEIDEFKQKHNVETTPQVFIGGERVGGYSALRDFFGLAAKGTGEVSYRPVIALFSVTALMALATSWAGFNSLLSMQTLSLFVAFSMCVLAILKLSDLYSFSNQFVTYDLLARRFVPYAYVYPFAEAFVGIGMLSGTATTVVAMVALTIGTIGAVSVVKAVYIDKRELRCACVGGNSKVPLGLVSLSENLMMVAMGLWMLVV